MFVLDRIKMLKVTDDRFTPPKDFDGRFTGHPGGDEEAV